VGQPKLEETSFLNNTGEGLTIQTML